MKGIPDAITGLLEKKAVTNVLSSKKLQALQGFGVTISGTMTKMSDKVDKVMQSLKKVIEKHGDEAASSVDEVAEVAAETSYVKSSDDLLNIVPGGQTPNGYTLTKHAADTINDSSRFSGTLGLDQIDDFILNTEIKVLDTTTNNVNLFKMTDYSTSSYTRVTIPSDGGQRIISTGFDGINSVTNKINNGRYVIID